MKTNIELHCRNTSVMVIVRSGFDNEEYYMAPPSVGGVRKGLLLLSNGVYFVFLRGQTSDVWVIERHDPKGQTRITPHMSNHGLHLTDGCTAYIETSFDWFLIANDLTQVQMTQYRMERTIVFGPNKG
jgi:hypothetical protein